MERCANRESLAAALADAPWLAALAIISLIREKTGMPPEGRLFPVLALFWGVWCLFLWGSVQMPPSLLVLNLPIMALYHCI